MDHLLVYDTETAGLTLAEGVVEHAYLEIDDHFNVLGEMRTLIKPPGAISPSASGVHGLTLDDVKDAPTMDEFMRVHHGDRFADKHVLIIAHNAVFDIKYIAPYCGKFSKLCTLKLARIAFPSDGEGQAEGYVPPPDHKLPSLMYYLGLKRSGTHNALDDVNTCLQLLVKCCEKLGLTLEEAYELCNKPVMVKKIGFGKHKGKKLTDLPRDYVAWLKGTDNLDENLRWSLEQMGL